MSAKRSPKEQGKTLRRSDIGVIEMGRKPASGLRQGQLKASRQISNIHDTVRLPPIVKVIKRLESSLAETPSWTEDLAWKFRAYDTIVGSCLSEHYRAIARVRLTIIDGLRIALALPQCRN